MLLAYYSAALLQQLQGALDSRIDPNIKFQ